MCGSTRATTSPSSSSTRRSTPCAAGCCGPKLMVKLRRLCSVIEGRSAPWRIASSELRMANGEWRMASFRRLVLQRPYQGAKHFAQALALRENRLQIQHRQDANALRQKQMRFELFQRALRDSRMLHEASGIFSPVTFRNIGWNRPNRAPDL